MGMIQSQSTSNPCSISQGAAVAALERRPQDFMPERNAVFRERRDLVVGLLNQAPASRCHRPEGAFYVYPSCAGAIGRRTPRASRHRDQRATSRPSCSRTKAWPWSTARPSASTRTSASPTPLDTTLLEDACHRIIRFCERLGGLNPEAEEPAQRVVSLISIRRLRR